MNKKLITFALIALALLWYALQQALYIAPMEETMGDIQRIFYYHVPSAMVAFTCFFANLVASLVYLKNRKPATDAFALATAEVGVVFCTVVLITGPLWAKPVWGIWWTWDARLTSTLLLWLIYVSYLLLRQFSTGGQAPLLAAILAIFGSLDVVFVYMSIRWFRTQHPQPVIAGGEGSGLHPAMALALLWNLAAFLVFAAIVVWIRYRLERTRQQLDELHALAATEGGRF
jgi:heme exporter protein C